KRDEAFGNLNAPLPQLRNAGPCPFVKVLYDASRYVEFKNDAEASAAVGFTGEIQKVASACAYKDAEPIRLRMQILFELGRGPQAAGARKTYQYWVAVTDRNRAVLSKQFFDLPVTFPAGADRVTVTEPLDGLAIPRADSKVSGANFEVLVGFEVTPAMADFNRQGKRFRPNAGQTPVQATAARP
ncbi:MAG: Tat pathway signal sequence domain protein, partial [Caulobacteraceae bacterium]